MKKLFFFRSSTDKPVGVDNSPKGGLSDQEKKRDDRCSASFRSSNNKKHASENQCFDSNSALRRSRSFSSAAFLGNTTTQSNFCLSDQSSSPSSSSGSVKAQQHNHSSRCTLTPERRHVKAKRFAPVCPESDIVIQKPFPCESSRAYHDSSGNSSHSSSSVSNEVLDLYIDGEQHNQRGRPRRKPSQKDHIGNCGDKKPPRIHCTAPASPARGVKDNPSSNSFRGARGSQLQFSSRDRVESGFGHESPQELAKHIVEKLCHTQISPRTNSKQYDPDGPITIQDVYSGSLNRSASLKSNGTHHKGFSSEGVYTSTDGHQPGDYLGFEDNNDGNFGVNTEDEFDVELRSKFKEAQERILFLSEELEQELFLRDIEFNVPALIQRIKDLNEEKVGLALEVSSVMESHLADRASMKEQLRSAKLEMNSCTRKLQKEKNEIQSTLEKELDRRSSDWSLKVENFQAEERRLRERVRELAEQNVSLQREVSCFSESETERENMINFSGKQIKDLSTMLEASRGENQDLCKSLNELQDKYKMAVEDRDFIQKSYGEKDEECKELHTSVTRLLRATSEQEKTIDGLRGELAGLVQQKHSFDKSDKHVQKLQMEQIRLTGVEQALRREVESYKLEVDSLRQENINLLNRLKGCGKDGGFITFKLDQELWTRLECLQKQGLSLLNESTHLCFKLLESIKRMGQSLGKKDGIEVNRSCLDAQFVIESDMKVQGFRRGTESLTRSLENISIILHEKSDLFASESQVQCMDADRNGWNSRDMIRSELKAETLITSLLREKLYAKDREVEQLQAELATATRGNDILRCEVQSAFDSLSCVTHKMKELELQMMKKEEKINQLQSDLQESTKELTVIKGILPKVTQERDVMWEEVKQSTENNMLLSSEVNMLKKKIEALDEDILLKEGQITILKDTLGSNSFDLLASPGRTHEFLLE